MINPCTQNINLEIESEISCFFEDEYDLFLIGSRANKHFKKNSDFDYILILDYEKDILILSQISNELNIKLNNIFKAKISIKIFDLTSFKNLYVQDYFRYLEYKISHKSIKNKNKVFGIKFNPLTNEALLNQLNNSIIIQYWWSIITISNHQEIERKILTKLKNRIKRNIKLYNSITGSKINETEIIKNIAKNDLFASINELSSSNFKFFLTKYFNSYEHELINKSNYYYKTILEKFPSVKKNINKYKSLII